MLAYQIAESTLKWQPTPTIKVTESQVATTPASALAGPSERLTIAEAKTALAVTFGVSRDKIEITIRG